MQIEIKITERRAELQGSCVLVCGNTGDTVKFIFDNEWGKYSNKTARFGFIKEGAWYYTDVLFDGSVCEIPMLSGIDFVEVGVYAGNLSTTTPARVPTKRSILCRNGLEHEPPPEDVYNQILESVANKLPTTGGTVTGDYYKDGNVFIHEGNLDKIDPHVHELVDEQLAEGKYINEGNLGMIDGHANVTAKATGNAITIDSSKAPLQGLKLYGKTTQAGTPTPDAPVPLVSAGDSGKFKFEIYGKNLLDVASSISFTGDNPMFKNIKCPLKKGVAYTLSFYTAVVNASIQFTYTGISGTEYPSGTNLKLATSGKTIYTFTPAEDVDVVRLYINAVGVAAQCMIEKGNALTTYEECNKEYAQFPYTLRSVGSIKDELNFDGEIYDYFGKGIHVQNVKRYTLLDFISNCSQKDNTDYSSEILRFDFGYAFGSKPLSRISSNRFQYNYIHGNDLNITRAREGVSTHTEYDIVSVLIDKSRLSTPDLAGFTTYLQNNETIIQVVLNAPIETPVTETDFSAFRQIRTNKDSTTIFCEAEAEVDYYPNNPNAQAIGNIHDLVHFSYFKLKRAIIELGGSTL